jgi:hypothetical protein
MMITEMKAKLTSKWARERIVECTLLIQAHVRQNKKDRSQAHPNAQVVGSWAVQRGPTRQTHGSQSCAAETS